MLTGSKATITEHVTGLAATFTGSPFPDVKHIHGGAKGTCPGATATTNHDGVISTTEGKPVDPGRQRRDRGARPDTLDRAKAATTEKSALVPSLPLAATAHALCGSVTASQVSVTPAGAPQTGGGCRR